MYDIVTFGSAVVDVFVDTGIHEKKNTISYPVGAKILIKDLKFDIGGGGTNTAVAFARFGLKTGCICKLGDDENGRKILGLFKKEKIRFLGKIERNSMSGYSIILDSKEKSRTILTYKGLNNNLNFGEIDVRKIKTKWIYYSSLLGESFKSQKYLAEVLAERGVKLAFNPSDYLIKEEDLSSLLKLCEVLILNKEEARMLADKYKDNEKDLLKKLGKLGPKIVVVTDKNKSISCYNSLNSKKYFLKPHKIKVVERTGAGDAFASGFVAGLVAGKGIEDSLKLGLRESEAVIRHFGAKNNLLRMKLK